MLYEEEEELIENRESLPLEWNRSLRYTSVLCLVGGIFMILSGIFNILIFLATIDNAYFDEMVFLLLIFSLTLPAGIFFIRAFSLLNQYLKNDNPEYILKANKHQVIGWLIIGLGTFIILAYLHYELLKELL